jgi:hypothetical protein
LAENEAARQHIDTLLHDKNLQLGPFIIDISKVKEKLLVRLTERDESIHKCIKTKIVTMNGMVEA